MIRKRIKEETTTQHQALESISYSREMAKGQLTLEQYAQLIRFNYAMNASFEKTWLSLSWELPTSLLMEARHKVDALLLDLEILKIDPDCVEVPQWPQEFSAFHQFMGSLYVIEGSTLGGSVIHRMLAKNPHLEACGPFHFYNCYGAETGRMWKIYLEHLHQITAPQEVEECISYAKECFAIMERWMSTQREQDLTETVA